jgi:hypothetical protein
VEFFLLRQKDELAVGPKHYITTKSETVPVVDIPGEFARRHFPITIERRRNRGIDSI